MKTGFENKRQLILLGALGVVFLYVVYTNVIAPPDNVPPQQAAPRAAQRETPPPNISRPAPSLVPAQAASAPRTRGRNARGVEFKMRVGDGVDPASIDPALRLDLLERVQSVAMRGGERNLFQFGAAPMPKTPEPKVIPQAPEIAKTDTAKPVEAAKPQPPPIPLKFYGYSQARPGVKRAFFLDGDEIIVADEGALVKKRYRVVRIGINSVVVEDTEHKHEQTLALQEPTG
ncbi:MAG: hypothetical protein ACM3ZB_12020 [bacterium]|jgi:hypothetical protein